jgi:hypothetical protein
MFNQLTGGEMLCAVEGHVFQIMGCALLVIFFIDRTGGHMEPESDFPGRRGVGTHPVAHAIV